jgi:hypothetical protein
MSSRQTVDFRLDGRTLVRLVDAAPRDADAVGSHLGLSPLDAAAGDTADLTVRYVDHLGLHGPLRVVGRDEGAYTDDAFVERRKGRAIGIVPLERIGVGGADGDGVGDPEIVMIRGSGSPGRLVSLLNLAVLGHGRVALHGSSVVHAGRGIAAVGWSGSGKTEVLLGFMARGALAVGDEWLHAAPGEDRVAGLPTPVRVEADHLGQLPELRERIPVAARAAMRVASVVGRGGGGAAAVGRRLGARAHVDLAPARLFGSERLAATANLDVIVWLEPAATGTAQVVPIEAADVARRLALAHVHHRRSLMEWYWQGRYAFPERSNPLLDDNITVECERLVETFAGRPAFRARFGPSVGIASLTDAIEAATR